VRLILGEAFGLRSPVTSSRRTLYAEGAAARRAGARAAARAELAAYLVEGAAAIGDCALAPHTLAVVGGPRGCGRRARAS
jgi:hypothetical protein